MDLYHLKRKAIEIRKPIIEMLGRAGSGHPGGSLSIVEILVLLYYEIMRHDPNNPRWEDRDRLILSKGHAAPALYAILADLGYFPRSELLHLRRCNHILQGHPYNLDIPGVEATTGSLGHGLSFAVGVALAGKLDRKPYRVYVVLGDGEIEEGQIWEAAMSAYKYKLDNLCAVLDHNRLQIDGTVFEIKRLTTLPNKWRAFGWHVIEVDGHNFMQLRSAFQSAAAQNGCPTIIIAHTIKGKGVSYMENRLEWHGKAPKGEEISLALKELDAALKKLESEKAQKPRG